MSTPPKLLSTGAPKEKNIQLTLHSEGFVVPKKEGELVAPQREAVRSSAVIYESQNLDAESL